MLQQLLPVGGVRVVSFLLQDLDLLLLRLPALLVLVGRHLNEGENLITTET
jgi:hypothetical protein